MATSIANMETRVANIGRYISTDVANVKTNVNNHLQDDYSE